MPTCLCNNAYKYFGEILIDMWQGGFWIDDSSQRQHCYKVIPDDMATDRRAMTLHGFDTVYQAFGELGYRFRDAGHNDQYVIVSLNKPLTQGHLRQLAAAFSITSDTGSELAFV